MRRLAVLLGSIGLALSAWADPAPRVSWPIAHYFASADMASLAAWQREVRQFRKSLRAEMPRPDREASLLHPGREAEFVKAADPRSRLLRDPLAVFETPRVLSWIEVIEADGAVKEIYIISSNGTKASDRATVVASLAPKRWKPATTGGVAVRSFRTANINLGDSPFFVSSWMKRIAIETALFVAILLFAGTAFLVVRMKDRKPASL